MIQSHSRFLEDEFKPDLTPMIDIIFIVMVFLLLTANVSVQTLNVDIPKTEETSQLTSPDKPVISIGILHSEEQKWALDGEKFNDWNAFTSALLKTRNRFPDKPFVIAADKKADVESLLNLFSFMQKHQIPTTNIVMEEQQ
ncbi:ExbD/TolR family protein [Vibrio diazotrophicus]|uniref:Biopolymer transporter ExbD n=1 Tax=Vibrio diazotrophicus TaxID=685 RepID=A0ABX4W927_VIBDI|nr:biopolymer transporter ExbD [Vibrio diazotrophicus]PNI00013.1 biopolymer transporter ExbD [Vibrio diazotrophicus]